MGVRIYLSPPDVGEEEKAAVLAALDSGWVAPLGPEVDGFEADIAAFCGVSNAVALSSGTAALHLGLLGLGVGPGDDVVVPTLTFAATAFAVTYLGARPVFIDSEERSWNLDPDLLGEYLAEAARAGTLPAAVVPVDVFGRTADYDRLLPLCAEYGVPVLVDAAESLGARHRDSSAGAMGAAAVFSFNGNKIITTSGGGAIMSDDTSIVSRARYLSTQARQPVPWYEHEDIGFNYRMSNILAALGRAQLRRLPAIIERRRQIRDRYADRLHGVAGMVVVGDPEWGASNAWLTTLLLPEDGPGPTEVVDALRAIDVEARHLWKPMHLQPVFAGTPIVGGAVAESLFARGVCLPSGARMTDVDVDEVSSAVVPLS
jgi:dTDP-4-amino-4,6-dideoxygalactose transaminase